jgi:Putative zinc-finger
MTGGRRFSLSSPDWGQDHLSLDAIVAYVDDELAPGAHDRAEGHLTCCSGCRAEVLSQLQARSVLRRAAGPSLPSSLLHTLRSIPVEAELPPPPPGLGITADGQFVLLRDVPPAAHDPAPAGLDAEATHQRPSRRSRFGAVSGLALGALAVGALAAPGSATPDPQNVLPGGSPNVQARLSTGPDTPALTPAVAGPDAGPADATPAVVDDPAAGETASQADPDQGAVLDARVRDQLERRPVAFYYPTP